MELSRVTSPKTTLAQAGKQSQTVSHIHLHVERHRTAIDKGVTVVEPRPVIQHLVAPVHRFISGKSGNAGIEKHDFAGIGKHLEVVAAFGGKLCHRYLHIIVRTVFQQVFTAQRPFVAVFRIGRKKRPETVPSVIAAFTSMPCIPGRHRWAFARPVNRASDAASAIMYFLMFIVPEVR